MVFYGTFPLNDVTHRSDPQKDRPWAEPRRLSHEAQILVGRFELGVGARKKRTGREKVKRGYISPISGEAPHRSDVHEIV